MTYFSGDPRFTNRWKQSDKEGAFVVSDDGKYFFFITHRGDISCDCNIYELQVFSVEDIKRAKSTPAPLHKVSMRSASSDPDRPAIAEARWDSGKAEILFVGTQDDGRRSIFRLAVLSGMLKTLTSEDHDVLSFRYDVRGDSVVYLEKHSEPEVASAEYPMVSLSEKRLARVLIGSDSQKFAIHGRYQGGRVQDFGSVRSYPVDSGPWLSPTGRYAIMVLAPDGMSVPLAWSGYDGMHQPEMLENDGWRYYRTRRFMLLDLREGNSRPVYDAPSGSATYIGTGSREAIRPKLKANALWSQDGSRVVLVNTALPLAENVGERQSMAYIVDYEIGTGQWTAIEPLEVATDGHRRLPIERQRRVKSVKWLTVGGEFLVEHETGDGQPSSGTVYRLRDGRWIGRTVPTATTSQRTAKSVLADHLEVSIRESANDPPIVMARDGKRQVALTEPDPVLLNVWRAQVEPVEWREPAGQVARGGLMIPRDRATGERLPLVIQAHAWNPDRFQPDGNEPTGYAAQPLASAGMAVLIMQVSGYRGGEEGMIDGPSFVARIDAAVDSLAKRGLVDSTQIGLIGVDDSAFLCYYAVTHPGYIKPAAAVISGGLTRNYTEYLWNRIRLGDARFMQDAESMYGGGTFWDNKAAWLTQAPGFNADRIQTPLLLSYQGRTSLGSAVETFGSLLVNKRPFEVQVFPDGQSELQRPRERLASLQSTVDWMAFWLRNYEDRVPAKQKRYARWRELRQQQEALSSRLEPRQR